MSMTYHEQLDRKNTLKLRELQAELPAFAGDFFRAMEIKKATNTRRNYAYDLSTFFYFLKTTNPYFKDKDIRTLPVSILDMIQPVDIEEYLSFLTYYEKDGQLYQNHEEGKARKLATLNTFFGYFHKKEMIEKNAPSVVDVPRVKEKNIIRLDANEVAQLIDNIESGEKLTKQQKVWHDRYKLRDLAIVVTLLGTGVRVTELVGLDISDLDFDNGAMRVIRKGGNEDIVYFGEEVEEMLRNYLDERLLMEPEPGNENALFISQRNTRITVRSVERLVKKYGCQAAAIQCWNQLQSEIGIMPCAANALLNEEGIPVVCETDIHGAITALMVEAAGRNDKRSFFADWTVRHPDNENGELLQHCGPWPISVAQEKPTIGYPLAFSHPGAVEAQAKLGEMTLARFDGDNGEYSLLLGNAKGVEGPYTKGTYVWVEVQNLKRLEAKIVEGPYIHHCVGIHENVVPVLYEACKYIGIAPDLYDPIEEDVKAYLRGE